MIAWPQSLSAIRYKLGFLKVDDDIAEDLVDVGELDDGVKGIPMTELVYRWC
jgi:hypothetical protein